VEEASFKVSEEDAQFSKLFNKGILGLSLGLLLLLKGISVLKILIPLKFLRAADE